jgi:hypothetical protein
VTPGRSMTSQPDQALLGAKGTQDAGPVANDDEKRSSRKFTPGRHPVLHHVRRGPEPPRAECPTAPDATKDGR